MKALRSTPFVGVAVAALFLSLRAGSQSPNLPDFDSSAAERHFREEVPNRYLKNLHEFERDSDGSKGFGAPNPMALLAALPSPPPPPFATDVEWATYYQYCGWDAIVRATHVDSTPILTRNKGLIFTASHFTVVDTLKSDVPFTPGQDLVVYRLGGEVEDGGEYLRIDTHDMAAFEPQRSYLLILKRDKNASIQQYWIPQSQTIAVRSDRVYPISGKYAWLSGMGTFPSGSTYAAIRATFAKVHTLKACPDSQ